MKTSKYAPKTPAQSLAQSRAEKLSKNKENAARLLVRLRWKAELLMLSYHKAAEIVRAAEQHINEPGMDATSRKAESMFKVDFFEFYTLLERYITTCLSIVGVHISGAAPSSNVNALRYITNPDLHRTRPVASHAFHANLLEALDDESCPLHDSFGVQDVRIELGLAKDFRNTWKDADERVISSKPHESGNDQKNITLHDSQLENMLIKLVTGAEHAHAVVQAYEPPASNGFTSRDYQNQASSQSSTSSVDAPFEYMDDAMDLS